MIQSGLLLMIIGMTVVFIYLALMIVFINLFRRILAVATTNEQERNRAEAAASKPKAKPTAGPGDAARMTAVVTAAVEEHLSKKSG